MAGEISLADLQDRLARAVCDLYRYDGDLLGLEANERSITHKLAEHMQRWFPGWHVDCEYNRRGEKPKTLDHLRFGKISPHDTVAKTVYPDIIVHRRNTRDNLLVLEFKKKDHISGANDEAKIRAFTTDESYQYRYGLLLALGPRACTRAHLFQDGMQKDDWTSQLQRCLKELGYGG